MSDPTLRLGTDADAAVCARLHAERITDGVLPALGVAFLTRVYRRIVRDPYSFVIVATVDFRVVGFVAGTHDTAQLYRRFAMRDGALAGLRASPRLLRSVRRVWETVRYPSREGDGPLPPAELLSLAVAANAAGQGIGGMLVLACLAEFGHRGVGAVRVIVSAANHAGLAVYRGHGFTDHTSIEVHKGERSEVLVWQA